jgi:hypothetical protein
MSFQLPARLPSVLASAVAAGLMIAVASCSHVTPLGPDPAATITTPRPHQLRSPLVVQDMQMRQQALPGMCPAGYAEISGGYPGTCYRKTGPLATIASAGVSSLTSFQPPTPQGQQEPPIQYGFWISLPAADAQALTAVTGPPGPVTGAPQSSAATSDLTVSVADRTWALIGYAIRPSGREFEVFLSGRELALQLQQVLASSG